MKRLLFVLLAGCHVAPRPGAEATPLGAERVAIEPSARPVVELRVVFEGGSVDDPKGREGLAALTVATMLEGRTGALSYAEREERLFPMAAELEGRVSREQIVFAGRVHRDHLAQFYPIFRDVLRAPAFEAADFERVRAQNLSALTEELRGADDEQLGKELLQAMLYEGHPYGTPELGTEHGLRASTPADARAFWSRVLCAKRVRAVVTGAIDDATALALRTDLAALTSEGCSEPRVVPAAPALAARRLWIVDKPEAQSVAISVGMALDVTRSHADYPALVLGAAYLGQHRTFAGLLMQRMRGERGLNYGDYAYAEHFVQDGATRFPATNVARHQQYFSLWIRPVPPDKAQFALRMAVRELERFAAEGIPDADFARIQGFVTRYFALFAQTEQARLGNLLDDAFYGVPGPHLARLCERMAGLTRDEVNQAIRRHVHAEQAQLALVSPRASELAEALVSGAPSPITYAAEKPPEVLAEDRHIAVHPLGLAREQVRIIPLAELFR